MNNYESFIHQSRYARWLPEEGRRETWEETVYRYISFMNEKTNYSLAGYETLISDSILNREVMPSMRALMTAGVALERDNVAGYNCSYLPIDHPYSFDEAMYILMCGTGVGFSVERQFINQLPVVGEGSTFEWPEGLTGQEESWAHHNVIHVGDSKYGWATGLRLLVHELYSGNMNITWDLSLIRPAGAPLVKFGGRASGPEPLNELFYFVKERFSRAYENKRRLTSEECHDIMCKIGEVVVVGGVRRSALISLSNLSDDRMRRAKSGNWWDHNPQRALANNSICFTEKPDFPSFLKEWHSLYESYSGERGIFNRCASQHQASRNGRRDYAKAFGTNPCSEIILRPYQFCNLSEVIVRADDTLDDLRRKVTVASILGSVQSTMTDFVYLRDVWRENTEEERLLGVSLTGIMDHPVLNGSVYGFSSEGQFADKPLPIVLEELKEVAIETNKEWADKLGIQQSAAITCVKPSGTVSQLTDSASGIHPRFRPYYIRRVRCDVKDPVTSYMKSVGIPWEEAVGKPEVIIFSFPMKAPEGAVCVDDVGAMEQLKLWMTYQEHWCEHKPSITVYYKDDEYMEIGDFVWKNFDKISGISFLPHDGGNYAQMPYEEITEEEYHKLLAEMPKDLDWTELGKFESEDNTVGSQSLACAGGVCEVVDLTKDE